MKFAATVLCLGCAVLACKLALQSKFFPATISSLPKPPEIRQALSRFWRPFPSFFGLERAHTASTAQVPEPSPISLPRAETLKLIGLAAARHRVPAAFVKSIVAAESNFDCEAVSPKGAIGLMQLMPGTAEEYGADPTIPAENIDAGTRYLRVLMNRYGDRRSALQRVIAAYNAGPAMVDRYRGIPPFRETHRYVARVLSFLRKFRIAERRENPNG